jgi:hypothetical protein
MYNAGMIDTRRSHSISDPLRAVCPRRVSRRIKGLAPENGDLWKNGENGENGGTRS